MTWTFYLADRGYDTNAIVAEAIAQGMDPDAVCGLLEDP